MASRRQQTMITIDTQTIYINRGSIQMCAGLTKLKSAANYLPYTGKVLKLL